MPYNGDVDKVFGRTFQRRLRGNELRTLRETEPSEHNALQAVVSIMPEIIITIIGLISLRLSVSRCVCNVVLRVLMLTANHDLPRTSHFVSILMHTVHTCYWTRQIFHFQSL